MGFADLGISDGVTVYLGNRSGTTPMQSADNSAYLFTHQVAGSCAGLHPTERFCLAVQTRALGVAVVIVLLGVIS